MASEGVCATPWDAILWAILTDQHGLAISVAELESGQLVGN